jgi:hypothetical protein
MKKAGHWPAFSHIAAHRALQREERGEPDLAAFSDYFAAAFLAAAVASLVTF